MTLNNSKKGYQFIIAFVFSFLYSVELIAQRHHFIDSLLVELRTKKGYISDSVNLQSARKNIFQIIKRYFQSDKISQITQALNQINRIVKQIFSQTQSGLLQAYSFQVLGFFYSRDEEDFPLALYYLHKALDLYQEYPNEYPQGFCSVYYEMALCTFLMQDYKQAIDYVEKLKSYSQRIKDDLSLAKYWKLRGLIHLENKEYTQSLSLLFKSLYYNQQHKKKNILSYTDDLNNIAEVYQAQKQYAKADSLFRKALYIFESVKIPNNMPYLYETYNDLGELHKEQGHFQEAIRYSLKADSIRIKSKGLHADHFKEKIMRNLYLSYKNIGQYAEALKYIEQEDTLQGKLYGIEREKYKRLMDLRVAHETEEQTKELSYQRVIAFSAFSLAMLGLVLVLLLWSNNYQKQKANRKLKEQKEEIQSINENLASANTALTNQKKEIEYQHLEITESINYAKRIQEAILPFEERIGISLQDYFIFYEPKDIVSGDFYYFNHKDERIIFAAVDCTGHGVPGAFMSMIGSEILNEIVNNKHITEADLILNELNRSIKHAFLHGAQEIKDGMDIALLSINKGRRIVEFAGAKNPVVYIQNNELKIIKGNVHHIGGERIAEEKIFTKHVISIAEPTTFYVFSDGFQDQFGGKDGKKYMTLKFRAFLFSIHHLPLEAQKTALKTELAAWKGERVQLDDILVMGVRL